MSYEYQLLNGSYYLFDMTQKPSKLTGQREIALMTDEVALVFDRSAWILHKHGKPEVVQAWYNTAREKFQTAGFEDMANDLVMIQGAFPIEELNRCLSTSGYIETFFNQLMQNKIESAKPKV